MKYVTAILTAIGLLVVGIFFFSCLYGFVSYYAQRGRNTAAPANSSATVAAAPLLELTAASWHNDDTGCLWAEGEVKNVSAKSLNNVVVNASFYDENGGFITSTCDLIRYEPILPGQTSPFKMVTGSNPTVKSAKIEFSYVGGGTIDCKNALPKPQAHRTNK